MTRWKAGAFHLRMEFIGELMFFLSNRRKQMSHPLLCIGHSHVACVARAAEISAVPLKAMNFWDMPGAILREQSGARLSAPLVQQLEQHPGPVFSMIGGAAHGVLGMLVHPCRFDFVLPMQPGLPLDQAAEVLPAAVVRGVLESLMTDFLALMSEVRRHTAGQMFHLEPPPPFADSQRLHADMPWDMYPGMVHEVSPAYLRYKLWRMHSQVLAEWCAGTGATLVACPREVMDESGFMREIYYGDGAHANTAYGELVLEQMRQLV